MNVIVGVGLGQLSLPIEYYFVSVKCGEENI